MKKAQEIAEVTLKEKIQASEKLRAFTFEEAKFVKEYPPCFVFAADSEEMGEAGYAPAALFVYVDKIDGHVWSSAEQDIYFYPTETTSRIAA